MPVPTPSRSRLRIAASIVVVSAAAGMVAGWRAEGLRRSTADWLMEQRGILPVPQEIAIAAIDDKSIAALGRFPWPRSVLAKTIDTISAASPAAIAVDVLFADPTFPDEDDALARSIGAARNVVLAAQLTDSPTHGGPVSWLLPIHPLANAAAGVGHVNVLVEAEGVAREIAVQAADDAGRTLRALAVEAIRVGDRTPEQAISFTGRSLVLGDRAIQIESESPALVFGDSGARAHRLQTGRMRIDYIGPAGAFDPVTYSIADILHGVVPPSAFRGKYVLIGATAASQSDRVASPFLHRTDLHGDEHGVLMPGVEVLANAVATILHGRFYTETADWAAFLWAALAAALTLLLLDRAQGRFEIARQAAALALLALAVALVGRLEYTRLFVIPPLVPALTAIGCAALASFAYRAFAASAQLDASIADLSRSSEVLPAAAVVAAPTVPEWLPHGLEWKARQVRDLNQRLVERARFVDQALRSVDDGLIIADPDGAITFANRSAAAILGAPAESLRGHSLTRRLGLEEDDLIQRATAGRERIEREIEIQGPPARRYVLRMAAVPSDRDGGVVVGIVASLADVTRQHELQQTKNDVIALVSHEMRTPLTAIQGMTELLAGYDLEPARRKEIAGVINDEVKRLTRMITEYLDITRLESGATAVRKAPVNVNALLERLVLLHEPAAARRGIRIQLEPDRGLPALLADADLLSRAVENLLSNAIKYGPDDAPVILRAFRAGGGIAISVTDRGCGIPEESLPRIFEKFYRVPRVEDAGVPGAGLGLALVREIAELHGGAVSVASKAGEGSTFTLRLPLKMEEARS